MESEIFQRALGRLEAAVERVERAAGASTGATDTHHIAALEARHARLRDGATEALARLDRLIGDKD